MPTFYGAANIALVPAAIDKTCMVQSDNKPLTSLMVYINNCLVTLSVTVLHLQYFPFSIAIMVNIAWIKIKKYISSSAPKPKKRKGHIEQL